MRFKALLATVAGAIALRLALGVGFATTTRSTRWCGASSWLAARRPATSWRSAPTPHPLLELVGVILAPLGASATLAIVVALAYLALSTLGYSLPLGSDWFSWPVGLAAAALILSRYEVLSYGARAYADIPYAALVLAALGDRASAARGAGWSGARDARPRRPAAAGGVALRRRLLAVVCGRAPNRASEPRWRAWSRSRRALWGSPTC